MSLLVCMCTMYVQVPAEAVTAPGTGARSSCELPGVGSRT